MLEEIPGIHCPHCGSTRHDVVDSRPNEMSIKRRRRCVACKQKFTTFEMVDDEVPTVGKAYAIRVQHIASLARRLVDSVEGLAADD